MFSSAVAALFPGQGSQYPGMSKVLFSEFPWTKQIYEEASEAIHTDLKKLCDEGPSDTLQLTFNAQPCILVTSVAWFRVLEKNLGFKPSAGAGHSLGEYSALVASGALSLESAIRLVRKRGEMMQEAVPKGQGKMAAVIGLKDEVVEAICKAASKGTDSQVVAANYNAPSQIVVAGHAAAVDRFQALATGTENPEWKARKLIPLNVSAPFHSPLMGKMAQDFFPVLDSVTWSEPTFPVVSNLDAQIRSSGDLRPILRDQIDHPVLWTSCVKRLEETGIKTFVEMGPSRVLSGLVKRIADEATTFSIDSLEDLKALENTLKGDAQ